MKISSLSEISHVKYSILIIFRVSHERCFITFKYKTDNRKINMKYFGVIMFFLSAWTTRLVRYLVAEIAL